MAGTLPAGFTAVRTTSHAMRHVRLELSSTTHGHKQAQGRQNYDIASGCTPLNSAERCWPFTMLMTSSCTHRGTARSRCVTHRPAQQLLPSHAGHEGRHRQHETQRRNHLARNRENSATLPCAGCRSLCRTERQPSTAATSCPRTPSPARPWLQQVVQCSQRGNWSWKTACCIRSSFQWPPPRAPWNWLFKARARAHALPLLRARAPCSMHCARFLCGFARLRPRPADL